MSDLVVAINVCDIYADASRNQLVSQAIMGQSVSQTNASADRLFIATADSYAGHVRKHVVAATRTWHDSHLRQVSALFAPIRRAANSRAELITTLVLSTTIAVVGSHGCYRKIRMPDGTEGFILSRHLSNPVKIRAKALTGGTRDSIAIKACKSAAMMVGTPYLWGGCTPFGIDCSGFVQLCYRLSGIQLLRDAHMQFDDARFATVAPGEALQSDKLQPGDLVFFGTTFCGKTKVTHVGMILPNGKIIHAAGGYGVVIESRDEHRLTQSYLSARRLQSHVQVALAFARP